MNKAFEKILEKFDECIATRNESLADHVFKNEIRHAKTIVQEVAEEYKGGWIPCSERLPDVNVRVMTTNNVGMVQIASLSKYGNFVIEDDGDKYVIQVIAWQTLPEPYI